MAKVKPIPDGYQAVTPLLVVDGAARAMEFYGAVFGAKERMRMAGPGGTIVHAEMTIGDSALMIADANPETGDLGPRAGQSPVRIAIYVEDVDDVARRAVAAGAKILIPIADQFYGDRGGRLEDPFGHVWIVQTHIEDVSPDEMRRRMEAFSKES